MKRSESGSATIEALIGVLAFGPLILIVIFAGRNAAAHQAVESAAADAARSASIARTAQAAKNDAESATQASLSSQELDCLDIDVTVDTSQFRRPAGQPATVNVTVSCRLDLSDLSVPGIPGNRVVRESVSSAIDTWRQRK